MRHRLFTVVLSGALAAAPLSAWAAPARQAHTKTSTSKPATHSTVGVVKSISSTAMVLTRRGKHAGDMTFTLDASTHRDAAVDVGSEVSVRYRQAGTTHVATAVTARHTSTAAH